MSTRSCIGMQMDSQIRRMYCHWDGYPSGVGSVLQKHYQDPDKISKLIDMGYAEAIYSDLDDIDTPVCATEVPAVKDKEELLESMPFWVEYAYLYRDGAWYCKPLGLCSRDWKPLKDLLDNEEAYETEEVAL